MIESGFPDCYLLSDLYRHLFSFFSLLTILITDFHLGSKPRRGIGTLDTMTCAGLYPHWFSIGLQKRETPHNDLEERKGVLFRDKLEKKNRFTFTRLFLASQLSFFPCRTLLDKISNIWVVGSGKIAGKLVTKYSVLRGVLSLSENVSWGQYLCLPDSEFS